MRLCARIRQSDLLTNSRCRRTIDCASSRIPLPQPWQKGQPRTPTGVRRVPDAAADFYGVERPGIRVLAARPLRVREGGWASELFGDYSPETLQIRVWMRTAVRKQVTSLELS